MNRIEYNEKQQTAINSSESKVVIIAPAGSGKTATLVGAIEEYKREFPNNSVTAITFTRKATAELKERLYLLKNLSVATIHSWSYSQLVELSNKVMKDPKRAFKIRLLDEEKIKEILKELTKRRRYYYVKINELFYFVMGNYNLDITEGVKRMYEAILSDYIQYKTEYGLYDFTDLPKYLLDKLNDTEENINGVDALFVDEFQDVDPIQLEVLDRVLATKKFFIGDFAQSIYQFRGATIDIMDKIPDFSQYDLDVNYRSYQEIIDFASQAKEEMEKYGTSFSKIQTAQRSDIHCVRGYGGKVYSMNSMGQGTEINLFTRIHGVELVKTFLKENAMFLCRTNREVKYLNNIGIEKASTVHQAKGLEYNAVVAIDFEIKSDEDVNVGYVALTRAKNMLLATNFEGLVRVLKLIDIKKEVGLGTIKNLF